MINVLHHRSQATLITSLVMLKEVPIGDVITYGHIDTILGYDVRKVSRSVINRAINAARVNDGLIFDNIKLVGFRRIGSRAVVDNVDNIIVPKIVKLVDKGVTMLNSVDTSTLDNDDAIAYTHSRTKLGFIKSSIDNTQRTVINQPIVHTSTKPSLASLFGKKRNDLTRQHNTRS